jgi:hypothetical protein
MHSKHILTVLSIVAALAAVAVVVSAGNPNTPPGPPETTSSYTLEHMYERLSTGADGTPITFTEPISGPGSGTMHTLDEIMAVAPQVDDTNGATVTQVMTGTTYWGLRDGAWGLQTGTMLDEQACDGTTPAGANCNCTCDCQSGLVCVRLSPHLASDDHVRDCILSLYPPPGVPVEAKKCFDWAALTAVISADSECIDAFQGGRNPYEYIAPLH